MENTRQIKNKVLSAKRMIIPSVLAILVMHLLIVFNTIRINDMGNVIAEVTKRNFQLSGISNSFSQATDAMTSTAMAYVNSGEDAQLDAYFEALDKMQDSYGTMMEFLQEQEQARENMQSDLLPHARAEGQKPADSFLEDSHKAVMERRETEMTALTMAAEPRSAQLENYPQYEKKALPADWDKLPQDAKLAQARGLLQDSAYQSRRGDVQRNLSIAVSIADEETAAELQQCSNRLADYRLIQWILMGAIIITMLVMIALLFAWLINPLERSVELVQQGIPLSTEHGFSELRRLANSYDELLIHRNRLEQNLREISYTDALTGLPNRLAYQEYLKGLEKRPEDSAVTVYSMDVNGLKDTNDSRGHLCGDILLRNSAACILKVFGNETGKNVFRIGGDEFAAICLDQSEEDIARMLESFREEQTHYSISISVGYAHAKSLKDEKIQKLFEQADQDMYDNKAAAKKNRE